LIPLRHIVICRDVPTTLVAELGPRGGEFIQRDAWPLSSSFSRFLPIGCLDCRTLLASYSNICAKQASAETTSETARQPDNERQRGRQAMTTLTPGTPGWVDLGTGDLEAAKRFYGELFGWTTKTSTEPESGGYTTFHKDGKPVAGVGSLMSQDQPTAWTTYVITDSADDSAAKVEAGGGKVVMGPFDVFAYGRMAVLLDPTGAAFAVWQPGSMIGGELFNVPGSLIWNELMTRDAQGAKEFYSAVFGWGADDLAFGSVNYTEWRLGGKSVGGMMPMTGDEWPADLPPHWMVYFAVEDCDAAADRAGELGGSVSVPPTDIPPGRFAVLTDPQGAVFSILQPKDQTEDKNAES
jgi:uncharacterized protein